MHFFLLERMVRAWWYFWIIKYTLFAVVLLGVLWAVVVIVVVVAVRLASFCVSVATIVDKTHLVCLHHKVKLSNSYALANCFICCIYCVLHFSFGSYGLIWDLFRHFIHTKLRHKLTIHSEHAMKIVFVYMHNKFKFANLVSALRMRERAIDGMCVCVYCVHIVCLLIRVPNADERTSNVAKRLWVLIKWSTIFRKPKAHDERTRLRNIETNGEHEDGRERACERQRENWLDWKTKTTMKSTSEKRIQINKKKCVATLVSYWYWGVCACVYGVDTL